MNQAKKTGEGISEAAITVGGAQIHFQQVQLRDDILIDEIHLSGKAARYEIAEPVGKGNHSEGIVSEGIHSEEKRSDGVHSKERSAAAFSLSVPEMEFTAMITEPNIQRLLSANMPADSAVRNVRLLLLSGKARITGQFVKSVISLPFVVEAIPVIDNGVRIKLDFKEARLGIKLPGLVLDVIEQIVESSLSLDLSNLSFPVRLHEIKCEPGRLTVKGKTRINWPPVNIAPPLAPFVAMERALPAEARLSPPPFSAISPSTSETQK